MQKVFFLQVSSQLVDDDFVCCGCRCWGWGFTCPHLFVHLCPPIFFIIIAFLYNFKEGRKKGKGKQRGFEILFLQTFIIASEFCPLARGRAREDHKLQLKRRQDTNKTFGDSDMRVRVEDIGACLSSEDRCLSRRSELVARVTCASLPSDRGRRLSRATAALCLCFSWKEGGRLGGFWWRVIAQSPHMDTTLLYSEVGYRFYFLVTFCRFFHLFWCKPKSCY